MRLRLATTLLALGLGLLVRAPALEGGLASDDYVQAAMLEGTYPAPRAALDLYDFADGSDADRQALMDAGALPWWSAPGLRLAMMRPLASALVGLDHALIGNHLLARHLHSALWWVLAVLAVGALLHAVLPPPVAGLALLFFAVEEGHSMPFGWLANRGALLALAFGFTGVYAHVRFRRDGWRLGLFLGPIALGLALASGEWALAVFAYVLAYELVGTRDPWPKRVRALVPAGALVLVFVTCRILLGYGTRHSGVYVDPFDDPPRFVTTSLERLPVFVADLVFAIPSFWWDFGSPWRNALWEAGWIPHDRWDVVPEWRTLHTALGAVAAVVLLALARWCRRDLADDVWRDLRWLLLGAALSLLPMIGSFAHSRLVLPASVAVCATAALVVARAVRSLRAERSSPGLRSLFAGVVVLAVVAIQGLEAGRTSRLDAQTALRLHSTVGRWALDAELAQDSAEQRIILLTALEHTLAFFTPFVRAHHGLPSPRSFWTLSTAPHPHELTRPSADTIELEVRGGTFFETNMERLYRPDTLPFHEGDRVRMAGMQAEIVAIKDGRPQRVRFRFDRSLDDSSYVVLDSTSDGLRRVRMPTVGDRITLAGPAFPHF